jgi:single-strand DNA-binding protein
MANYNHSNLVGRLADDPKLAPESFGRSAATIQVVVNDYYRDNDNRLVKTTDSFRVRLYGQPASYAAMYLGRGSLVMVNGRLKTEKWKDKVTQETRYSTVIVVDDPSGLQGLADPGHSLGDGSDDEPEHTPSQAVPDNAQAAAEPLKPITQNAGPALDAGSAEFEAANGIQPIPF